jgi:fimbrial chaperone protein
MSRRTRGRRTVTGLLLFSSSILLLGFRLEPISQDFAPSGAKSSRTFRIDNPGETMIAVQVSVATREVDLDGREVNRDASGHFLVYPSRLIVKPRSIKTVRVKYIGPPDPPRELAYRIIAEEVPVNVPGGEKTQGGGIRLVFKYIGNIYIVPRAVKEDVILESARVEAVGSGARELVLIFHNRGTRHTLLGDLALRLSQQHPVYPVVGARAELDAGMLKGVTGENILAGQKRRFRLPAPQGFGDGEIEAEFSFRPIR